jgi:hypothetical protein
MPSVRFIDSTSGVTTTYALAPSIDTPLQPQSVNFSYPIGIAVDSKANVYVADGRVRESRYGVTTILPTFQEGAGSGVWKITPGSMHIFAGVIPQHLEDGMGGAAGFALISGMVVDKSDNLFVNDYGRVRKVTPDAQVSSTGVNNLRRKPPLLVDGHAYGISATNSVVSLESGVAVNDLTLSWDIVLQSGNGDFYTTRLSRDPNESMSIYRKRPDSVEYIEVVKNVKGLHSAAFDEHGTLYLKQKNAVVKVVFN